VDPQGPGDQGRPGATRGGQGRPRAAKGGARSSPCRAWAMVLSVPRVGEGHGAEANLTLRGLGPDPFRVSFAAAAPRPCCFTAKLAAAAESCGYDNMKKRGDEEDDMKEGGTRKTI
jgi:hypothetical protein